MLRPTPLGNISAVVFIQLTVSSFLSSPFAVRSPQLDDNSSSDSFVFAPDTNDNDAATNGTKIDSSDDDDHDEDDYEDQDDETEEMEGVGAGFFRAPRALGPNAA